MRSLMDATVVDEVKSQWKRVTKSCSLRKPLFFATRDF